jgi:hypothetical protein
VTEPGIIHPDLAASVREHLRLDPMTVTRTGTSIDAEGDPTVGTPVVVLEGYGTLVDVSAQEELLAAERGTRVDKALLTELGLDIFEGDRVAVRGATYEVVSVDDKRIERRALVRKTV